MVGVEDAKITRLVIQQQRRRRHRHRHVTAGILLAACRRATISWSACEGGGLGAHTAVQVQHCQNVSILNVRVLQQRNAAGNVGVGIAVVACDATEVSGCHIGGISSAGTSTGTSNTAIGVMAIACITCRFIKNFISSISSSEAYGMYMAGCRSACVVDACCITHIGSPAAATLQRRHPDSNSSGVTRSSSTASFVLQKPETKKETVFRAVGVAVHKSMDVTLTGCSVQDVTADGGGGGGGMAAGFLDNETNATTFSHCSVKNVVAETSTGFGGGGLGEDISTATIYDTCHVSDCGTAFDVSTHQQYYMHGCTARHVKKIFSDIP